MTARLVRPARTRCRNGRPACDADPTLRITSPNLHKPVDRCAQHVGESIEAALWALAELGEQPAVTVTPITRES